MSSDDAYSHFGSLHQLGCSFSFLSLRTEATYGTDTLWSQANVAHACNSRPNNGFDSLDTGRTTACKTPRISHNSLKPSALQGAVCMI